MKSVATFLLLIFTASIALAQDKEDWSWWNNQHGWKPGMPGWRNWIVISPGFLGPNALPVPDVKKGFIVNDSQVEVTTSYHFHDGDPTQDISGRVFLPFAKGKIAVEMYGVLYERYNYTTEIRNERFSRDRDGKGYAIGDFYFSTLIQVAKDRKFPNTLFRIALKTASGNNLEAARYADTPGYFFDFSFSKNFGNSEQMLFRPFGMIGFYSWQTNDELNLQNDACLYGAGFDLKKKDYTFTSSVSGYQGYKDNGDRPAQLNFQLQKDWGKRAVKLQYQHGLHDWLYRTVRFSFLWKFNSL